MDDSTSIAHTTFAATSVNTNRRRKTRGAVIYTKVKKYQETIVRYPITIDVATDRAHGEHADNFMGYSVLQGRSKMSILMDSWHDIKEELKDSIWEDVQDVFIVSPDDDNVKNKMLTYYGERWRGFKTQLTHDYIKHGEDKEKSSYDVYSFIDQDVWEKLVESRTTLTFLAKSQKGKENRARNIYTHRLSRGGYQKLEKTMIEEKNKT
ncbi:unnamed protein product [Lathyrus oleraceus]